MILCKQRILFATNTNASKNLFVNIQQKNKKTNKKAIHPIHAKAMNWFSCLNNYKSRKEAVAAFGQWKKRYERQGYYSSVKFGRINLLDLQDYCELKQI